MRFFWFFMFVVLGHFNVSLAQYSYETISDISYYSTTTDQYQKSQCKLDIYYPKDKKAFATVIWLHGGGLSAGSKYFPKELLNQGFAIVSVGYRLIPKAQNQSYLDDAAAATAWVIQNIAKYGGNSQKIVLSGHSAGCYLALMISLDKNYLAKYNANPNQLAKLVSISGQAVTHFAIRKENNIPENQVVVDKFAPLFHVNATAPPIVLITGDRELELLGRYEENALLARMLKISGHTKTQLFELDGYDHNSMLAAAMPRLIQELKALD